MERKDNFIRRQLSTKSRLVQAPMLGVTTPEMVAAANDAGALGSLALGDLAPATCEQLIRATKKLTERPFAVNLFSHHIPLLTGDLRIQYNRTKDFLERLAAEQQLEVVFPEADDLQFTDYRDQLDVIIEEGCRLLSVTFGCLDPVSIDRLKDEGVVLMGTCTSVEEALHLQRIGMDIIIVQGIEAGGHRGSFLGGRYPQIGGLSLLSQVRDQVDTPLIYAGGVYGGRTAKAAHLLGADVVQVGSMLLCSRESALLPFEKEQLRRTKETDVVLTDTFTGRPARGLRNAFVDLLQDSGYVLPYPYQNKLTQPLRQIAKLQQNAGLINIWRGQSSPQFSEASTKEILLGLSADIDSFPTNENQ